MVGEAIRGDRIYNTRIVYVCGWLVGEIGTPIPNGQKSRGFLAVVGLLPSENAPIRCFERQEEEEEEVFLCKCFTVSVYRLSTTRYGINCAEN